VVEGRSVPTARSGVKDDKWQEASWFRHSASVAIGGRQQGYKSAVAGEIYEIGTVYRPGGRFLEDDVV
jgi:hypothetical protein